MPGKINKTQASVEIWEIIFVQHPLFVAGLIEMPSATVAFRLLIDELLDSPLSQFMILLSFAELPSLEAEALAVPFRHRGWRR